MDTNQDIELNIDRPAIEEPTSKEALMCLPEIKMTREEFDKVSILDTDGDDSEANLFMEDHGLKFGDDIIVHIEGDVAPRVVGTTAEDFFTTSRQATAALHELLEVAPDSADTELESAVDQPQEKLDEPATEADKSLEEDDELAPKPVEAQARMREQLSYISEDLNRGLSGFQQIQEETVSALRRREDDVQQAIETSLTELRQGGDLSRIMALAEQRLMDMRSMTVGEVELLRTIKLEARMTESMATNKVGELSHAVDGFVNGAKVTEADIPQETWLIKATAVEAVKALSELGTIVATSSANLEDRVSTINRLMSIVEGVRQTVHTGRRPDDSELQYITTLLGRLSQDENRPGLAAINTAIAAVKR